MSPALTPDDFAALFDGNGVTLMGARPLRRELVLLRAALPPVAPADRRWLPLTHRQAQAGAAKFGAVLPAQPSSVASTRHLLARLEPSEIRLLHVLILDARRALLRMQDEAPLFLVPTLWSLRMIQTLDGTLYPACIRSAWIPRPRD